MTVYDGLAMAVLAVLLASAVAIVYLLGSLAGRIARKRHHPHAEAVTVAGWVSLIFIPLWPLALIWAYLDIPRPPQRAPGEAVAGGELGVRVAALEAAMQKRPVPEAAE